MPSKGKADGKRKTTPPKRQVLTVLGAAAINVPEKNRAKRHRLITRGRNRLKQESHAAGVTHWDVGHADNSIAPLAFGLVQGAIGFVEQFVDALIR